MPATPQQQNGAGRNLVVCLDGTKNEPEQGSTNVARLFDVCVKNDAQLAYYDPGVGTMGARGAVTKVGKALTRGWGLVAGYGVKDNLEEAYNFLANNYRKGDRIFVFGFSRGAYTARALTGMLNTIGLLRPGAENLTPYAVKLYAQNSGNAGTEEYFKPRNKFRNRFGNPDFPSTFDTSTKQVHFLGVWDTVKSVGALNVRAGFEEARWPYTAKIANVNIARHAMALDERRRPYGCYRFDATTVKESDGRHLEVWFPGVHSDVGGQYDDDHHASDVAFDWMLREAHEAGLALSKQKYSSLLSVPFSTGLPAGHATEGWLHPNGRTWILAGGWRSRRPLPGDLVHPTVDEWIDHGNAGKPYRPDRAPDLQRLT
ncbi:DUF2235 domain-containing protein [Gordonia sp. ABSL49_1]|uniref:DUF2235 domain-containing protein n=1 Tax=unclassified Gordonia (in: high G+C Gram-positive bacteria) TaxID=2657482 RepID=UPI001F0D093B|nr:DUF2235 domain-containing protein [Gordonia sp. ABSL49_1]MCH5644870.1 DUF2235 domain-containing protein [Gordonia sp. ABSL49_1]